MKDLYRQYMKSEDEIAAEEALWQSICEDYFREMDELDSERNFVHMEEKLSPEVRVVYEQ